jgi:hypothetical protein
MDDGRRLPLRHGRWEEGRHNGNGLVARASVGEEGVRGGGVHVGEEGAENKEKGKGACEVKEKIHVRERLCDGV